MGPAFLVYYSPAFLRNLSPADALPALRILAEVYRRARQLWPLRPSQDAHHSVTIRIDQLKELKLSGIMEAFAEGESWLLVRQNDQEGVVERHRLDDMAKVRVRVRVRVKIKVRVRASHLQKARCPPQLALCSGEWPWRCTAWKSTPSPRSQRAVGSSSTPSGPARSEGVVPSQCCAPQAKTLSCFGSTPCRSTRYRATSSWFCHTASWKGETSCESRESGSAPAT